jgi:aspartyl-tRNA synthetase
MENVSLWGREQVTEPVIRVDPSTLPKDVAVVVRQEKEESKQEQPKAASSSAASSSSAAAAAKPSGPIDKNGRPLKGKQLARFLKREAEERAAAEKEQAEWAKHSHLFGYSELHQSKAKSDRVWTPLSELDASKDGQTVLVRARLHSTRAKGKLAFLVVRERLETLQVCVAASEEAGIPVEMVSFVSRGVPAESIVEIEGTVSVPPNPLKSVTRSEVELTAARIFVLSRAAPSLPIRVEDCERPEVVIEERRAEYEALHAQLAEATAVVKAFPKGNSAEKTAATKAMQKLQTQLNRTPKYVEVSQPQRLDNRVIDLRTTTNQAIFRISSVVCHLFRSFWFERGFVEIHTPKMLGVASEGGASVFRLQYFDRPAFLAQSPQLYKQMCIASDFPGVFEVGPVFRAESSHTHRHLTEFTGLDMEMPIQDHYHEVLDAFGQFFHYLFSGIERICPRELDAVRGQFPFEPFQWPERPLILTYADAVELLRADGVVMEDTDDIDTPTEKRLGALVRATYNTDFYMLDKFPLSVRPFYTMPDPNNDKWSNSYDFFMRGEEILSGAQRVHDPELLEKRAIEHGVDLDSIRPYIDSFKYGAAPHGGGGIGLERVVMLYLGLGNIRRTSLFPRDPERLTP